MKNTRWKWLLWAGVMVLLAAEMVALLVRPRVEPELATTAPVGSGLPTVAFSPDGRQGALSLVTTGSSVATGSVASVPPSRSASETTLQSDELRARVQPLGALLNEALLTFKTPEAQAAFLRRAAATGISVKGSLDELRTVRVGFEALEQLRQVLQNTGAGEIEAGANYLVAVPRLPVAESRNPGGDVPFGETLFSSMGIAAGTDRTQWGKGVTVAVLDSGVGTHPALRSDQVSHVDLVNDGQPFDGHGTAMASLIAGGMPGAEGLSPGARILDVRVADGSGGSNSFLLASGITAALERGAKVINISMGSYGDAPVVQSAVAKALQSGVVVVASAGNEQAAMNAWPAAYSGVISVSAVDAQGRLAYFSNAGSPTLAAPGVGIPSAYWKDNKPYLANGSGTSQSAALVSGAVAAIMSHGGNVMLTLNRNAAPAQATTQAVGAGILRLPAYR